jgi:hypothetical protein
VVEMKDKSTENDIVATNTDKEQNQAPPTTKNNGLCVGDLNEENMNSLEESFQLKVDVMKDKNTATLNQC